MFIKCEIREVLYGLRSLDIIISLTHAQVLRFSKVKFQNKL